MKFILLILIVSLFSCTTTKYVDRETVRIDSSMVEQNESMQKVLQETIERYEKEKEQWLNTGVLFDTVYRDTGSLKTINKITFDNGKIKTIEGRLLAVNQSFHEKASELLDAHSTIDSMSVELEKKEAQLSKKQDIVIKEVKRTVWPFWIFALCLAGGLVLEYRFKVISRIFSIKSFFYGTKT